MKKIHVLWIVLDLLFLIVFNALFFTMGGTDHNVSVWMSYGFIHFAYLMLLITPILIRGGKSSAVFGFSLYSISAAYFLIEFVTGVVFILIAPESYKTALLLQICIAGLYGIILVSHMIANERTVDAEEKRQHQVTYIKDASVRLKSLVENIDDKETKKKIEKVYDVFYSSPVKSHPNMSLMENDILMSVFELERAVSSGDKQKIISLAESLLRSINERNRQLKTYQN